MSPATGTLALVRFVLRRDRIRIPVWIVSLTALVAFSASSILDLYADRAELATYAARVQTNQVVVAMSGPAVGLDTYGGRIAFECWPFVIAVALMGTFAVGRHTRAEEESGRTELVRSAAVGRHAHSLAALAVSAASSLVLGVAIAVSLVALDLPVAGSLLLGASFAGVGLVFGGVSLVAAQVTEHARAATGLAAAVVGGAFVLRAVGDIGDGWLSWLSPFGWAQATQPYAGDRWWPLALAVVATGALAAGALAIESRRDVGVGLVRPRPGPAEAPAGLSGPLGLAWRLQRGSLVAWTLGVTLGAVAMGSVAESADDLVGDNEQIRDYLAHLGDASLADVFLATVLVYLALLATGFALQAVLRLRSEETALRAEPILATGVSRLRWAGSHLAVALGGAAVVLTGAGAGVGGGYALAVGDAGQVPRLVGGALAFLPAVGAVVAVAVALFGLAPRAASAAWGVLALGVLVGTLGDGLDLPDALRDLSPFDHVPGVPAEGVVAAPLLLLTALALLLATLGLTAFRHRDLG